MIENLPWQRVVIVASVLSLHDAISQAAVDSWRILGSLSDMSATLFSSSNEFPDIPAKIVSGVAELIAAPEFLAADLVLYHFGIFNPLFDAMLVGNGHAVQVVHFHNVTPAHLLAPQSAPLIQRSLEQIYNFLSVDTIWVVSRTNENMLREHGLNCSSTQVIPLVVGGPQRHLTDDKESDCIEILYLGRFVKSKGVLDLLKAFASIALNDGPRVRLRLAGSQTFSDPSYVADVAAICKAIGSSVEFIGEVDDAARDQLLREAHILAIPSYHEGFCKPVIEGLRAGCIPVGYAAYNLPDVCAGLGRLVPPGDVEGLKHATVELIEDLDAVFRTRSKHDLRLDRGPTNRKSLGALIDQHVCQFEFEAVKDLTTRAVRRLIGGP